jgi:hypothetical protein
MKKTQFESLCKPLLPYLSGFACKGWLLYARPLGHVLRGFYCDPSGFAPTEFRVHVFFLPLYVPTEYVHFAMGKSLKDDKGCEIWWKIDDPDLSQKLLTTIYEQGLPFIAGVEDPRQLADKARELLTRTKLERRELLGIAADSEKDPYEDPYKLEAIAYSLIMIEDYCGARAALARLTKALDTRVPWQSEIMKRANQIDETLSDYPHQAKSLLEQWEQVTLKNLDL